MSEKHLLTQLTALRKALRDADSADDGSFARVFNLFFDIADEETLMRVSKVAKDPVVRASLEGVTREFVGDDKVVLNALRMLSYRPAAFLHGGFFVSGVVGTFFYFPAEQQGLVAFNEGTMMTHFSRITATTLPPGTTPMHGPRGKA